MKKILAISGGGTRGVCAARWAAEIEKRANKSLATSFDLIAGTSTGSIIAALSVSPKGVNAENALSFYFSGAPKIFKRGWFDWGLVGPKYSSSDLVRELTFCTGEFTCKTSLTKLLIPTMNADEIEATFIKSWLPEWEEMPLWAAAAASSSAQTYFPAFQYKGKRYIDGGNHTNNPVASAMFEAARLWPGERLLVVSIGTGRQLRPKPLPDGGIARWAPLVFGTTSEGQDDCATYYMNNWPDPAQVFCFDVMLSKFPPMDDASPENLQGLVELTELEIANQTKKLDELCSLL